MRRLLMAVAVIVAVVMVAGTVSATLLGIKDNYSANVPDILYDAGGTISYDAGTDLFELIAWDKTLYLEKPGSGIDISDKVRFGLAICVDENGNFTGGVTGHTYTWDGTSITSDYDMVEYVVEDFSFEWNGTTYKFEAGDIFLAAEVLAFGWDEVNKKTFDFLFGPVSGKLVTTYLHYDGTEWITKTDGYNLWPTTPPTGAYVDTSQAMTDWKSNWDVLTDKGDKVPTPELATLLLLGSGLIGLAGLGRRKFKVR